MIGQLLQKLLGSSALNKGISLGRKAEEPTRPGRNQFLKEIVSSYESQPEMFQNASSAMGIPSYMAGQALQNPERALSTMARVTPGFGPALVAGDALTGMASEMQGYKPQSNMFDYLRGNAQMPQDNQRGELSRLFSGALKGIAAGADPRAMSEAGITVDPIEESLTNMGVPWWAAGAAGAAVDTAPFLAGGMGAKLKQIFGGSASKALTIGEAGAEELKISKSREALKSLQRLGSRQGSLDPEQMEQYNRLIKAFGITGKSNVTTLYSGLPVQKTFDFLKNITGSPAISNGAELAATAAAQLLPEAGQFFFDTVLDGKTKDVLQEASVPVTPNWMEQIAEKVLPKFGADPTKVSYTKERLPETESGYHEYYPGLDKHIIGFDPAGQSQSDLVDTYFHETLHTIEQGRGLYDFAVELHSSGVFTDTDYQHFVHGYDNLDYQTKIDLLQKISTVPEITIDAQFTGDISSNNPFKKGAAVAEALQKKADLDREAAQAMLESKMADSPEKKESFWKVYEQKSSAAVKISRQISPKAKKELSIEQDMANIFVERFPTGTKEEFLDRIRTGNMFAKKGGKTDIAASSRAYDVARGATPKAFKKKDLVSKEEVTEVKEEQANIKAPYDTNLFGEPITPASEGEFVGPPTDGKQMEIEWQGDEPAGRDYRVPGIGEVFSGKAVTFHHGGLGPEYDTLARAKDQATIEFQKNHHLGNTMEKELRSQMPWTDVIKEKTGGTSAIREQMWDILNDPEGDINQLPVDLQVMAEQIKKDQLEWFWEENRIRIAKGEKPYPLRHGYMYQIYEQKILDAVRKGQVVSPELLAPFNKKGIKDIYLGVANQRNIDLKFEPIKDPIASYIARKNINAQYSLLQPAIDKVQSSISSLHAFEKEPPKELMDSLNEFIRTDVRGEITPFDKKMNAAIAYPVNMINKVLEPFGKNLGYNPLRTLTRTALKPQYLGALWGNMKHFFRNALQHTHEYGMYGTISSLKGYKSMISGTLNGLKSAVKLKGFEMGWLDSTAGQRATSSIEVQARFPFVGLDESAVGALSQAGMFPIRKSDMLNIIHAGETGYAWSQSLINNDKWQNKMRAMAKAEGLEEDAYVWTQEDAAAEYDWAIKCAQYKYLVTGTPPFYRTSGGKIMGALMSWPMNYWNTFARELTYRAFTGKTGRQDSKGRHKPIPMSTRTASLQYLLVGGAIQVFLLGLGLDYTKTFLLGTIPEGWSPPMQMMMGAGTYMWGYVKDDAAAKTRGLNMLKNGSRVFVPGSSAMRTWGQIATGKAPVSSAFFYHPREEKETPPSRSKIRRDIKKASSEEFPTTGKSMLNL